MPQSEAGLYLAGLFLRFGVPLGLTLFLAWILKNMDLQWLEEEDRVKAAPGTDPQQRPQERPQEKSQGCWIYHNLPQEITAKKGSQGACWNLRIRFEGSLPDECLDCVYFKEKLFENAA
jgi:hypothetical protein